jgi:hypothetical protein
VARVVELVCGLLEAVVFAERLDHRTKCKLHVFAALGAQPRERCVAVAGGDPRRVGVEREVGITDREEAASHRESVDGGERALLGLEERDQSVEIVGAGSDHSNAVDTDATRAARDDRVIHGPVGVASEGDSAGIS